MSNDTASAADDPTIDTHTNPESFRDHPDVDHVEETKQVPGDDFAELRDDLDAVDGWVVVGLANDAGSVLLMDDGDHGWTLPAVSVRDGDWADRGRDVVAGLTGRSVELTRVERVRRIDYQEEDGAGQVTVHHVVLRAASVPGEPVADEPTVGCDGSADAGWFDALPDEVEGVVAADTRLFL